jgi:phage shock protein A
VTAAYLQRLERELSEADARLEDLSSAALLAVLTERIARISKLADPRRDLAAAIEIAQHVVAEYAAFTSRLVDARDHARAEASSWHHKAAVAVRAGDPHLASQAEQRAHQWELDEAEASETLAEHEAGRARLDDAVSQLQALANRSSRT